MPYEPSDQRILAMDQGGQSSRALVFDRAGRELARAAVPVESRHSAGRVEQDPDELVDSLLDAAKSAVAEAGPVRGAGLATQRSSIVCWDRRSGAALTPCISWQDRRAAELLRPLEPMSGRIARLTGLRLSPHYGASKLAWCLQNLPAVRRASREGTLLMGPLASFLLFRLLSERPACADPANASRTLLYDRHRHDWSDELLQAFGLSRATLPQVTRSRHAFGHLDLAGTRVPLTVCTGDQSAALFAAGAPEPGVVSVNVGTGAFLQQPVRDPVDPGRLLAGLAWRGATLSVHTLEGTINGAGAALQWLSQTFGMAEEAMEHLLPDALAANEEPPLFLNGIGGLGSPYWNPGFQSRFIGAGDVYTKATAIIESIVFLARRNLDQMREQGHPPKQVMITGGLANLDGLCRRLAALTRMPVERPRGVEATSRGLGWLTAGRPADWLRDNAPDRFDPESETALDRRYRRWLRAMEVRAARGAG